MNIDNNLELFKETQAKMKKMMEISLLKFAIPDSIFLKGYFESLENIIKQISPFFDEYKKINDFAKQIADRFDTERNSILQSGWWITPSMMDCPDDWIAQSSYSYKKGNKSAITKLFKKRYQKNNCKLLEETVNGWMNNKYFVPWKNHIQKALKAHQSGDYVLSIPAILLVAEGIATRICKKYGFRKVANSSDGGGKIKKLAGEYYKKDCYLVSDLNLIETAIDSCIYQNTKKLNKKIYSNILNRHAVLHGIKIKYGTEKASLQTFMLLDVLSVIQ